MEPKYVHTAIGVLGVVLKNSNQILLVLSKDRGWEPPQGFLEAGEAPVPALHREVLEETGYTIRIRTLTGIYHCLSNGIPIISICFLCEACERVTTKVEESVAVKWVDKENLGNFITHESHLMRVMDALSGQISVSDYRLHPFGLIRSTRFPSHQDNS